RVLAALKDAHPSDDGPPVLDRDLVSVRRHVPHAVADDLEHLAVGHLPRVVRAQVDGEGEAALHDRALAVAGLVVTRRAVDAVPLLATIEDLGVHLDGSDGDVSVTLLAAVEGVV